MSFLKMMHVKLCIGHEWDRNKIFELDILNFAMHGKKLSAAITVGYQFQVRIYFK